MNSPLQIVVQLFDLLTEQGIRYCSWKSNQHLTEALCGQTDIDLLVDQNQADPFEDILSELGFKRFISQPWARYSGIEDWIGFDGETGKLVHIHLHYQLVLGRKFVKEYHLPWEELILTTAIKDPTCNVLIADPNLEILLLVIRIGLKTTLPNIGSSYRDESVIDRNLWKEFEYLSEQVESKSIQEYAHELFGKNHGQQICHLIAHEDIKKADAILQIKAIVNKVFANHRRFSQAEVWGIYRIRKLQSSVARARRKLRMYSQLGKRLQNEGAVIAIIGCDGSGKSTVSNEIKQWLAWKIDARKIYLGSGDGSVGLPVKFLKSLSVRTAGKKAKHKTSGAGEGAKNTPRKASFFKEMGSYLLDLSITNDRYRKVRAAHRVRTKGSIIITDRYPQSQFVGIYDGPRISRGHGKSGLREFFTRLETQKYQEMAALRPDVVIKLHVPLEVAMLRKPGHNSQNIAQKAEITRQLRFNGTRVIDIDATQPVEDVLNSVKKGIWESI